MIFLRLTIPLLLALLSVSTTLAQESLVDSGVEWQTLEEAQKKAKETGKKVLVFGYADWCTYCMKMRKETYPEDNVQKSLTDDFIPVQINGESEEEIVFNGKTYKSYELARYLRLTSYPTHYFLNSDGKIIGAQPGFLPAEVFSPLMNYVSEDLFGKVPFLDYMEKKGIKLGKEQD